MDYSIFYQLGAAFLLSSLVGFEREQKLQLLKKEGFAGVRTFGLIGILGALAFYLNLGFRIVGAAQRQAKLGGRYIDEIIIEKFLVDFDDQDR